MNGKRSYRTRRFALAVAVIYIAAVAVVDFLTPLVLDVWVLYLPVILVPVWFNARRQVVFTACACSFLMICDALISHPRTPLSFVIGNLAMGLSALWLTALAAVTIVKRNREIENKNVHLVESEERLRLAMGGSGMGTWDHNLRTQRATWSETQFRMLGYEPAVDGVASIDMWQALLHPDDAQRVLDEQEQACRDHAPFSSEYRIVRADNGITSFLAVVGRFAYDDVGEAIRFIGVSFDFTKRKELEREVLEISDEQQRRISHELHDNVGQELTGMGLMANALAQSLPKTAPEQRVVARLSSGLDRIRMQVRNLSRGLMPVQVETKGLWAALDDLVTTVKLQSGIDIRLECPEDIDPPEHDTATQLFHIAQEALSNALRHGQPRHISVHLQRGSTGLQLSIRDDGVGLRSRELEMSNGMGCHIMRYRAQQIGGSFHISQAAEGGTVVTCTLPQRNCTVRQYAKRANGNGQNSNC